MSSIAARLWTGWDEQIAVLDFEGARALAQRIGGSQNLVVVERTSQDVGDVDVVLIDVRAHHGPEWANLLSHAYRRGVPVVPWARYLEDRHGRLDVATFDVSEISYTPGQTAYARLKRVFDLTAIVASAPVWLPLFALIACYVAVVVRGPVIFRQVRAGIGDSEFVLLKFRTLVDANVHTPVVAGDPRIIPALAWLRRTRLDELPQLINVMMGDMSLVGPRPESLQLAHKYEASIPQYVDRRLVLPGVTGWAQVNVRASSSTDEALEKLAFDLYYVKHLSVDLDLFALAVTARALFTLAPVG